ncbi:MAG TPA: ribosome biogenesis GTPase Der [Actinomycetota bacterium]
MTEAVPRVAIVGRQNVGKSTLVNRLFGKRAAIADDRPGVTRDRIELEATWRGKRFGLVDTAGFLARPEGIDALAGLQAERAAAEADLVMLVVDARAGVTEEDAALGRRLRRADTPVLLVANKVDTDADEADATAFYALGLGEPFPVSALHGRAAGDLLDRLVALLPDAPEETQTATEPRFAIVGRPNVGKSSLFNRLLGEDRSVVYEDAGTTRDAVDALVAWPAGTVRFIDTAGMRRQVKTKGVEYYGFVRASEAIDRAHVAIVVIDASEGLTADDKRIAARVVEAGRGLVFAANKWDLVEDRDRTHRELTEQVRPLERAGVMRTSATSGQGVHRLPPALLDLHERWSSRAPTAKVNEIVRLAQGERPAPRATGTIHYATQVSTGPPGFVLFGGAAPDAPYRRFLEHRLRDAFDLEGVPLRMTFRPRRRASRT